MVNHGVKANMSKPWLTIVNYGYLAMVDHGEPWSELVCFAGGDCNYINAARLFYWTTLVRIKKMLQKPGNSYQS